MYAVVHTHPATYITEDLPKVGGVPVARTVRDAKLESRAAREALARSDARTREPYWRSMEPGVHLGYYKGDGGGTWHARVYREGRYWKKALGTADDHTDANGSTVLSFKQAQDAVRKWAPTAGLPAALADEAGPYTVQKAVDAYLDWVAKHRRSHRTVKIVAALHILPKLGEIPLPDITAPKIRAWHEGVAESKPFVKTKRGGAPKTRNIPWTADLKRRRRATANSALAVLKAALNRAFQQGLTASDDAWRRVKPFQNVDQPVSRYLTQAEAQRLINACPTDFRRLVVGALQTGARFAELTHLQARDYNSDSGTLLIREAKGGKPRHVTLTKDGQKFFEGTTAGRATTDRIFLRNDGKVWGPGYQTRPLAAACKKAKIEPTSFHSLRRTVGSWLAMKGVPLQVIAVQLGHADERITRRHYSHLSPSYVSETIRAAMPSLNPEKVSNVRRMKRA